MLIARIGVMKTLLTESGNTHCVSMSDAEELPSASQDQVTTKIAHRNLIVTVLTCETISREHIDKGQTEHSY
jgi:hypothetical protein